LKLLSCFSIDIASSKSFASSQSIVKVKSDLKSFLYFIMCSGISDLNFFKYSFIFSQNFNLAHHSTIILIKSIFLSHVFHKISLIVPSGFLPVHLVICTQTISQFFASIDFLPGTKI
jgi:hypothetical protein